MAAEQKNENIIIEKIPQNPNGKAFYEPHNEETNIKSKNVTWITEKELVLEPDSFVQIPTENGSIQACVPEQFFSTSMRYPAGTALWMKLEKDKNNNLQLIQIMESDIHEKLSAFDEETFDKAIKYLQECPEEMRSEILQRRFIQNKQKKSQKNDMRFPEINSNLFRVTYLLSKQRYSLEQRDRIERLLPNWLTSFRGRSELQLDYIMNIAEENSNVVALKYNEIMAALDAHIYGQTKQKRQIAELLSNRAFMENRGVKILLIGDEGTGKGLFAETIRDLMQLPSATIELSGESNPYALLGFSPTYLNSDAGSILKTLRKLRTAESLLNWRNIDRMGESKEGVAIDALKGIFSEDCHVDAFTLYPLSTRHTVHIAEAAGEKNLPDFIRTAFEIIRLDAYTEDEKVAIAKDYIIPKLCKKTQQSETLLNRKPQEQALRFIVRNFSRSDGLKEIETCCSAVIKRLAQEEKNGNPLPFDERTVRMVLGDTPDYADPLIRYNLAKGKYTQEAENAIQEIKYLLRNEKMDSETRTKEELRLGYLVDMADITPSQVIFNRTRFLQILNETHFGLESVKERVADHFEAQQARGSIIGMRLLLEGPAGVGKTSFLESMTKALNAVYVRIPMNNVSDMSVLKGSYKTFRGADAGMPVKRIANARRKNTEEKIIVVHLDEVDKIMNQFNEILIDLLDDSGLFLDYFLGVPVKLSNVIFVGTANDISRIPMVIQDRFHVIHLEGYTSTEKATILTDYFLPEKEREYAASKLSFSMDDQAKSYLMNVYCYSAGVRDLKKAVDRITEYAVSHRKGENHRIKLSIPILQQALGKEPITQGNLPKRWMPGCAKALAVSEKGTGNCFAVESVIIFGEKGLTITGLAGESTAESVQIALTYLKKNYSFSGQPMEIHLSFGEGAIRKDGPSAGIAVLISLLSAMRKTIADPESAYTGEIDLLGNVYPVGGVIQKIQAAQRAGCRRVYVPMENVCRLTPQEKTSATIDIIPISHVEEVISAVFNENNKSVDSVRRFEELSA